MTKFTFIVAIYNVGPYLTQCIESIIGQTYDYFDILLIDDGSTDDSGTICDNYALKNKNINVLHQKNQGVSVARNQGLKYALGDWIIFVDGDDWVEKDLCSSIAKNLNETMDVCFYSYYENRFDIVKNHAKAGQFTIEKYGRHELDEIEKAVFTMNNYQWTNAASIWAKAFRRAFLVNYNLKFKERQINSQDTIFALYVYEFARKGIFINKPLYHYRILKTSVSRKYNGNIITIYNDFLKSIEEFVNVYKNNEEFWDLYYFRTLRNLMVAVTLNYSHPSNTKSYIQRRKEFNQIIRTSPYSIALRKAKIKAFTVPEKVLALAVKYRCFFIADMLNHLRCKFVYKE